MENSNGGKAKFAGDGIVIFNDVADAMKGERALKGTEYENKLIAPPPELRMGCDLALEINLVEQPGIERLFKEKDVPFVTINPLKKGASGMCDIVKVTDFGRWVMVKAGNMKISYEKATGIIVNISGGGCPDIPYLNAEMVDKKLEDAPHPNVLGYTLCATMLQRAYEESINIFKGGNAS
jgi:Putative Se/S carrier protein-like